MPIKTVRGLSRPIDTAVNDTWQGMPVQAGDTQTRETLHRTPTGEWVLHQTRRYWPIKPGYGLIEDSSQVYNAQHAVAWMERHGVTVPEYLAPVGETMRRPQLRPSADHARPGPGAGLRRSGAGAPGRGAPR